MAEELHKGAPPKHFYFSRENRKQSTMAEQVLWTYLRNRKLDGFKFRHQHPISDFIADFYCHECKLIIELDGEYHDAIEQRQYDEGRTYELNELKLKVIRFTNREIIEDMDFVLDEIGAHLLDYFHGHDKSRYTNLTLVRFTRPVDPKPPSRRDGKVPLLQERDLG